MKIIDLADSIWRDDLLSSTSISIPSITIWLRFEKNIGELNNLLNTTYYVDPTSLELIDSNNNEITNLEASIYRHIYLISFYGRQAQNFLGASGIDIVNSISSDGGSVRFINRNEIAKTYLELQKEIKDTLFKLINWYKRNQYKPTSIDSDETNLLKRHYPSPYFHNQINPTY
jgi:hypothetical protein